MAEVERYGLQDSASEAAPGPGAVPLGYQLETVVFSGSP